MSLNLQQLRCKTCGEPLDLATAQGGVIKCSVCDSTFTLPKTDAAQKVLDFLSQGEHDLDTGKFDDAYTAFNKAAELDKTEPEAYWGMALAEFKIQYLKDEVNNRLQPICHEVNDVDFADSANFLKAIRYATEAQRAEYERKGEEIDRIKREFYRIKQTGLDYDCFICVKVTDENGGRTVDYKYADDIYFALKGKGYKPFFSERELGNVTGADYEARILYALNSSECMLVVCLDEAYLRTKWVRNEYSRFLKLVNDEEKESDSIALVFKDRPIEKLPGKHGKIQGIDLNDLTAIEKITHFVEAHTPAARARRADAAKQQEQENNALKQKLAELEKIILSQQQGSQAVPSTQPATTHKPAPNYNPKDFKIIDGVLIKYNGKDKKVVIPDGVTSIGNRAFDNRWKITSVTIPNSVTSIGNSAFDGCSGITSINIPNGVTSIGDRAFGSCSGLTSITIPNSVTSIGEYAFLCCSGLTSITLPNNVTSFGVGTFAGCSGLTSIKLPNGVVSIGEETFEHCSSLINITIPNSVTSIGDSAFWMCESLTSLIIPNSVTSIIGDNVFFGCNALKQIYCGAEKKPTGWNKDWNWSRAKVIWGYKGEQLL